ncbi:MAG: PsiF family protein [Burkholderiales bacterium]
MALAARYAAAVIALSLAGGHVAQALTRDLTPAQQRMKACNGRAKMQGLEGAERGKFMNACLNGDNKPATLSVRQQRHEKCNTEARGRALEGAERRGYMTECEKGPALRSTSVGDTARDCEQRARGRRLEGEDRRAYIKGCLDAAAKPAR